KLPRSELARTWPWTNRGPGAAIRCCQLAAGLSRVGCFRLDWVHARERRRLRAVGFCRKSLSKNTDRLAKQYGPLRQFPARLEWHEGAWARYRRMSLAVGAWILNAAVLRLLTALLLSALMAAPGLVGRHCIRRWSPCGWLLERKERLEEAYGCE